MAASWVFSGMSISDDASRISRALVADLLASHAAQEQALRAEIVRLEQELSAMTTAAWMHAAKLHQHEQALSGQGAAGIAALALRAPELIPPALLARRRPPRPLKPESLPRSPGKCIASHLAPAAPN